MKRVRPGTSLAQSGYNLVALAVAVTMLNILVAAALPSWSKIIQREKEAELIFRGMQYAEALRVCQQPTRLGGLPTNPQQLVEEGCLRKLYKNPMSEDGSWRLIIQRSQGAQQGNNVGAQGGLTATGGANNNRGVQGDGRQDGDRRGRDGDGGDSFSDGEDGNRRGRGNRTQNQDPVYRFDDLAKDRVYGPISGVASPDGEDSTKVFMGSDSIKEWEFTAELAAATMTVSTPAGPQSWPIHADTFWRPWPPGITPPQLGMPGQGQNGGQLTPGQQGGQGQGGQGQGGQGGLQSVPGQQGGAGAEGTGNRRGVDVRGSGPRGFGRDDG